MKLVDIDDDVVQPSIKPSYQSHVTDFNFTSPRMLSLLDNSMNEILNRRDMDDGEKWTVYNQTLQRFLNYMKKSRTQNTPHTVQEHQQDPPIDVFDGHISDHNITGIQPLRDSLEYISQPNVRDFFQQLRESSGNTNNAHQSSPVLSTTALSNQFSPPLLNSPHNISAQLYHQPQQQLQIRESRKNTPPRRAPKRTATLQNLTGVPPPKIPLRKPIIPRALYRSRQPAAPRSALHWEITGAR